LAGRGGLTAYGGRSNRLCGVQIFQKPYLFHPDSELDVLYMDLDVLDETYPMVESKLHFEDFSHGGLTWWDPRLDRPTYTCQFWLSTYAPCFMAKLACQKTSMMIKIGRKRWFNNTSSIILLLRTIIALSTTNLLWIHETTCFGLHTCLVVDLAGVTTVDCSIDPCFRICCNLLFWERDKPEGHHLGCIPLEFCSLLLPPYLMVAHSLFLTRLLLWAIGLCNLP
jgi:hypothetical protein